jgi:hypothetical protein
VRKRYRYYIIDIFGLSVFRVGESTNSEKPGMFIKAEYFEGNYYYGDRRDIWRKSGMSEWNIITSKGCQRIYAKDINKILMMEKLIV